MLNTAQREVAESTAEQRAVGQLVQELFGGARGSTQQVLKRAGERLEAAKKQGRDQRAAATAARREQHDAEARLAALAKRMSHTVEALISSAAAASVGLQAKSEELDWQAEKTGALEEELRTSHTETMTLKQQQQQQQLLKQRYKKLNSAHTN